MVRLTCHCLNISIHVKSIPPCTDLKTLGLRPAELSDAFFKTKNVAEVQLDLGGISEEQKCLVRSRTLGEWSIKGCINCRKPCYATHISKGMSRVLVNLNLVSDVVKQEELQNSAEFSHLFRIVLHDISKINSPTLGHPTTDSLDTIKKTVGNFQEQLVRYLNKEKQAMAERIKKYTEDQQSSFVSIQKKVYRDKDIMVGLIVDADEKSLEDSLKEAMLETSLTPPQTPISVSSNNRVNSKESSLKVSSPVTFHIGSPPSIAQPAAVSLKAFGSRGPAIPTQRRDASRSLGTRSRARSNDADTMFNLDGFNDDCDPFFESDDECSTDDNSLNDDHPLGKAMVGRSALSKRLQQQQQNNFAASVPISMPMWNRETKHSFEDDEDDEDDKVPMPEPDHMVASMKALSLSVQDGTEMFGDLPRPRLNTDDALTLAKKFTL